MPEWQINVTGMSAPGGELPPAVKQSLWAWFDAHQHAVVLKRKVFLFKVTVTVSNLRPLFDPLLGKRTT